MSQRTTEVYVKEVLGQNYGGGSLKPYIDTAVSLVDWLAGKDTVGELSASTLELIERWLAGHFYSRMDPMYTSKSTDGASGTFEGQTAMVLHASHYGQTAIALDTTGRLSQRSIEAANGKKMKASLVWLGKRPSTQIPYTSRD